MIECYTPIPRGIASRRQHEPLDTSQLGPIKIDPARPTTLESEIMAVILGRGQDGLEATARRILKIDRIRRALALLEEHERVDECPSVFESSDD